MTPDQGRALPLSGQCQVRTQGDQIHTNLKHLKRLAKHGAGSRNRTYDLLITNETFLLLIAIHQ
jgi:hypothetical protein